MAMSWIILMVLILIFIVTLAIIFIYKNKGKKHEPDYYTFFIMGIIWTGFGVVMLAQENMYPFFLIMGLAFMAIGLANKKKWKKPPEWKDLSEKERKVKMIAIIAGVITLVMGLIAFLLVAYS